jgi:DNA repair exonuclease SbcCD nuclease subunit
MAKKIMALASGDWHFNDWNQFNENNRRLLLSETFMNNMAFEATELGVPIIFTGDMFHTPKGISTGAHEFMSKVFRHISEYYPRLEIWGISGNHDLSETNTPTKQSPSLFRAMCHSFPNLFKNLDFNTKEFPAKSVKIFGIPFLTHNTGLSEVVQKLSEEADYSGDRGGRNILVIHTDLWGARDPSGREVGTVDNIPRNLGKFFKSFDLVLSGHIHKYEELWPNQIYMVGAPFQQRKSDMGCEMSYLKIFDDLSVERVITNYPVFLEYREGETPGDDFNYWVKIPETKKREEKETKKFNATMNRTKMAKRYAEQKGITNTSKINALIEILNKVDNE